MNFNKQIILPLSDLITKWNLNGYLNFLQKSQWWNKDQIIEYQNNKFKSIVNYAYNNVPFYTDLYDKNKINVNEIKSVEDINKLPIISKDDIINHFNSGNIIASNINKNSYLFSQSSGSTGKRIQYYISKNAYGMNLATNLRGWFWMGYKLGDKIIKISQNERNSFIKRIQDRLNNTKLISNHYSPKDFEIFISILNDFKPKYIRSYPDPLIFMVNFIIQNNIKLPFINAINTTGNILFKEYREQIKDVFKCNIFDSYSCEGGPNVFECETHEYYHISDEYGILEILDENGNEVSPEEQGRVIVTDFYNYACPFIRYDSQDYAIRGEKCSCGRQLSTIIKIIGRDNDILITPSGQYLIGQTFTTYFKKISEIDTFRIIQNSINQMTIELVLRENLSSQKLEDIKNYWINYTNHEVDFNIKVVDKIELLPSDKRKFLYRDESIKIGNL